jgi:hypothetical protein
MPDTPYMTALDRSYKDALGFHLYWRGGAKAAKRPNGQISGLSLVVDSIHLARSTKCWRGYSDH